MIPKNDENYLHKKMIHKNVKFLKSRNDTLNDLI